MKLILLKHFNFSPEAELVKSRLEAEGIKSVIQKEGAPGASANLVSRADLFVREIDLEKIAAIDPCLVNGRVF